MPKNKFYFSSIDMEWPRTKEYLIKKMLERNILWTNVSLAVPEYKSDYFFCKADREIGEKGYCGKECTFYTPRNGKSGCCKHRAFCNIPGQRFRLYINGKLIKL